MKEEQKASSFTDSNPELITIKSKDQFTDLFKNNKKKAIVIEFYTKWCPGCKKLAPDYEQLAKKYF